MSETFATVEPTQANALSFVFSNKLAEVKVKESSNLFARMKELSEQTAQQILGEFGVNLWKFVQQIDPSHPDFETFEQGILASGSTHANRLLQIIDAWNHAKQAGWDAVLPLYRKAVRGLPSSFAAVRAPEDNQRFVRMVADSALRQKIRSSKQVRSIQLYPFYKKGDSAWHVQPSDFDLFVPGSKKYAEKIVEARKKSERFKSVGCEAMRKAVEDGLKGFLETFENKNYNGYYRITATNAAIILAKMHGYEMQSPVRNNDARMVKVPEQYTSYFKTKDGKPAVEDDTEQRLIEELAKMVAAVASRDQGKDCDIMPVMQSMPTTLVYAPTIYPLPLFLKEIYGIEVGSADKPPVQTFKTQDGSEHSVLDVINQLESALNGKPVFDHYLVMVPSPQPFSWDAKQARQPQPQPQLKKKAVKKATIKEAKEVKAVEAKPKAEADKPKQTYSVSIGDEIREFDDPIKAKIYLDTNLVRDRLVVPVLLGERDGQCYFLSFWR